MANPKTPGPKPRAGTTATNTIKLRATDDERARWQTAAEARGVSLAELVRGAVERDLSER